MNINKSTVDSEYTGHTLGWARPGGVGDNDSSLCITSGQRGRSFKQWIVWPVFWGQGGLRKRNGISLCGEAPSSPLGICMPLWRDRKRGEPGDIVDGRMCGGQSTAIFLLTFFLHSFSYLTLYAWLFLSFYLSSLTFSFSPLSLTLF